MIQTQNLNSKTIDSSALTKKMIIGAAIGLVIISFLVLPTQGKPEWGNYWKIRPLLLVPFAGAVGGLVFHFIGFLGKAGGWKAVLATTAGILIFIIGIWMGIVLGLVGTLWN